MTWKDFEIFIQRRSSRPLKTMMPHVIRKRKSSQLCMILRAHLSWIQKVMIENLLWKCKSLKSLCAEQCVDLDGVRTIEKCSGRHDKVQGSAFGAVIHVGTHWNVHVERRKSELADRATLRQTGTVPRHKVSAVRYVTDRVSFVHMPSD